MVRPIMLQKLEYYTIRGLLLKLFKSRQVVIKDYKSKWEKINMDVEVNAYLTLDTQYGF